MKGYVTEQEQADRTIAVTVRTWTTNALGFAQSIDDLEANDFNFAETSTIFGEKAVDVANGAKPALGHVSLTVSFSIPASGDRLPDLVNVVFNDICNFVPFSISLDSVILGTRPDGTKAILRVEQEGALEKEKQNCGPDNEVIYTKEIIEIKNIVE